MVFMIPTKRFSDDSCERLLRNTPLREIYMQQMATVLLVYDLIWPFFFPYSTLWSIQRSFYNLV